MRQFYLPVCLSVCHMHHISFVYSVLERRRKFMLYVRSLLRNVNVELILRSKGKRDWELKCRNRFCAYLCKKSGSIYIKWTTPKWSAAHCTHVVRYISSAETCNYFRYLSVFENRFLRIA